MTWIKAHYISPNFMKLWAGQFLAVAGTQFGSLAFPLVAISVLDASPEQLGILAGLAGLPWLLFGLFVGVGVDRFRRRPIIAAADFGRGIVVGWIAIAAMIGFLTIEQLYVAMFLVGTLAVLFETAYQSFLPSVVRHDQLVDASGKLAVTESITGVAGPSIAGFVIQATTASFGILIDSFSYFASAAFVRSVDSEEETPTKTKREPILRSLRDGFMYLWRLRIVRWFALSNATFMLFFTISQSVIFVFYTRDVGIEAGEIGLIFAIGNIGALLGASFATRIGNQIGLGPSIVVGSVLRACGVALIPVVFLLESGFAIALLITAQFVQSFGWSIWSVHQGSTRQILVPDAVRGRVNGSFLFLVRGVTSVGGFAGAAIVSLTSVRGTLAIAAIGVLVGSLWLLPANLLQMKTTPSDPLEEIPS